MNACELLTEKEQAKVLEALDRVHWEAVNKQLDAENWDYRSDREQNNET